jgi:cation diffusion facilitator family transporter
VAGSGDRRRDLLVAVGITIGLHIVLLVGQLFAASRTGSTAIEANAIHIGVDTAIHLVALGGVWLATRPADLRHPYGYERYESLASLLIGMLLLVAVALIASSAVPRLLEPEPSREIGPGVAVMATSALVSAGLAIYLHRRGTQLRSRVLRSEAVHAAADAAIALGVVGALALWAIGMPRVDPLVALGVAGVVAWRGWGVVRGAAEVLTDAAAVDHAAICAAALDVPGVHDCHAVRSRGEAGHVRVDLHVHVAGDMTVAEAHRIAEEVESRVLAVETSIAEVLVHLGADPG